MVHRVAGSSFWNTTCDTATYIDLSSTERTDGWQSPAGRRARRQFHHRERADRLAEHLLKHLLNI